MSSTLTRLIMSEDLPDSLWHQDALTLPPILTSAYISLLEKHGLRDLASKGPLHTGPIGGVGEKETNEHLAWVFPASAARVQLAVLDPHNRMPHVSDSFVRQLAGNKVAIADVPSGSGAAALSILTTLAELRHRGCIPAEPLDIVVIGGEISESARKHAAEGFQHVQTALEEQAIFVEPVFLDWDVCDKLSNTDLIKEITVRSQACGARLLIVANFSGFLQNAGKFKDATPQLEELFRHVRGERASVVWIEPQTNVAVHAAGGLFSRISTWLASKWASFVRVRSNGGELGSVAQSHCTCRHSLDPNSSFEVRLSVIRCDLETGR